MSELLRARVTRGPQRLEPQPTDVFDAIPADESLGPSTLVESACDALSDPGSTSDTKRQRIRTIAKDFMSGGDFFDPRYAPDNSVITSGPATQLASLQLLDRQLTAVWNAPDPNKLQGHVENLFGDSGQAGDGDRARAHRYLGESLVCLLLQSGDNSVLDASTRTDMQAQLVRLLLIIRLLEILKQNPSQLDPIGARRLLRRCTVVLPSPPFPLADFLEPQSAIVRRPAFDDLVVVRDEWSCYLPGEIADIQNVLKGERRKRTHTRLDETETTTTVETETTTTNEHDLQSTDRYDLRDEVTKAMQTQANLSGSVDVSGQIGTTKINTHLGGSTDWSVNDATQHALEQSKEVIDRSVTKVEDHVRQQRVERALTRIKETNEHLFDNTKGSNNVVGIYRWVDQVRRLQFFRYPNRYLLEFEVPEPGSYLRWLSQTAPDPDTMPPKPLALTEDGQPDGIPITPTFFKINETKYLDIGARYLTPLNAPPDEEIEIPVSFELKTDNDPSSDPSNGTVSLRTPPKLSANKPVNVPDGYEVTDFTAALNAPNAVAKFGDYPSSSDRSLVWTKDVAYHGVRGAVSIAGVTAILDRGAPTVLDRGDYFKEGWSTAEASGQIGTPPAPPPPKMIFANGVQQLDVAALVVGSFKAIVTVRVKCTATDAHIQAWQIDCFNRIAAAYESMRQAYAQAVQDAESLASLTGASTGPSPSRGSEIVIEELKRQITQLLLDEANFAGRPAMLQPVSSDRTKPPQMDIAKARGSAQLIQFVEQAFEWANITYVFYPYFWAASDQWPDLEQISGDDTYARMLRSGSARVVVPATPGFEDVVNHFLWFGEVWGGGPAPAPKDPLYVSVAQEIKSLTDAPDDGEPGESWEVRLPTTLVWLDSDSSLPRSNPAPTLTAPTTSICDCGSQSTPPVSPPPVSPPPVSPPPDDGPPNMSPSPAPLSRLLRRLTSTRKSV